MRTSKNQDWKITKVTPEISFKVKYTNILATYIVIAFIKYIYIFFLYFTN